MGRKKNPERDGNWTGPSVQAWWKDQQQEAKDGAKALRMVCTGTPLWLFCGFSRNRRTFSWPFSGIATCWQVDSREPAIISESLPPRIFNRILQCSPWLFPWRPWYSDLPWSHLHFNLVSRRLISLRDSRMWMHMHEASIKKKLYICKAQQLILFSFIASNVTWCKSWFRVKRNKKEKLLFSDQERWIKL